MAFPPSIIHPQCQFIRTHNDKVNGPEIDLIERMQSRPVNPAPVHPFVIRRLLRQMCRSGQFQYEILTHLHGHEQFAELTVG